MSSLQADIEARLAETAPDVEVLLAEVLGGHTVRLFIDHPKGVDLATVERHIREAPGVLDVHDLHAWTITSGMNVVSAHVVLGPDGAPGDVLDHLGRCLSDDFDVDHSTFQLETPEHVLWEAESSMPHH